MMIIRHQTAADAKAREELLDAAFGPARKGKSAYGLRAGTPPVDALDYVAVNERNEVLGCIHFTPVAIAPAPGSAPDSAPDSGAMKGLLLLGPLAVAPAHHGQGIGQALVDHSLARAAALGYRATILIGDPNYYGRFGFDHALVAGIIAPGETDQSRVQGHEIVSGAFTGIAGTLVSATASSASSASSASRAQR